MKKKSSPAIRHETPVAQVARVAQTKRNAAGVMRSMSAHVPVSATDCATACGGLVRGLRTVA